MLRWWAWITLMTIGVRKYLLVSYCGTCVLRPGSERGFKVLQRSSQEEKTFAERM